MPITILDNFFDNPDKIRDYGLSLEFEKDPRGGWPGVRTKPLHEINQPLFNAICKRIISLHFDLENVDNVMSWQTHICFQKVDKSYESGWVHVDTPSIFSAIIYLNTNPNPNSGTSIYKLKNKILIPNTQELNPYKLNAYKGVINIEDVKEKREENNNQYMEVVRVHNEYNRIICFDSGSPHAAQDFFGENDEEPRLTLNIFFNEFRVSRSPVERVHCETL